MVRSIVYETNSILFDLSPVNIEMKYTDKKFNEKLVASVMVAAKEYQPSIIYIDQAELVWPGKAKKAKKGAKKKGGKKKDTDPRNPARIKGALKKWVPKFIDEKSRITIIGCTNDPDSGSKKDFKKQFDKSIYFPFPDYTTRRLMWKTFIENCNGKMKSDFPLSTLAHISAGYSSGSIKDTVKKVLTSYRIKHMDQTPLALPEFIGPLS
jgi:SpoVK/Ycf46/Vps4 family AAA+-type ATPase